MCALADKLKTTKLEIVPVKVSECSIRIVQLLQNERSVLIIRI